MGSKWLGQREHMVEIKMSDMFWKAKSKASKSSGMAMEGGSTISRAVSGRDKTVCFGASLYLLHKKMILLSFLLKRQIFPSLFYLLNILKKSLSLRDRSPMILCD